MAPRRSRAVSNLGPQSAPRLSPTQPPGAREGGARAHLTRGLTSRFHANGGGVSGHRKEEPH